MEANNDLTISIMHLQDLEEIKAILEKDFDDFWHYSIFKSELENPHSLYFVAKKNHEVVGFAGILIVLDEADITNIVVKKNFRGLRYLYNINALRNKLLQR